MYVRANVHRVNVNVESRTLLLLVLPSYTGCFRNEWSNLRAIRLFAGGMNGEEKNGGVPKVCQVRGSLAKSFLTPITRTPIETMDGMGTTSGTQKEAARSRRHDRRETISLSIVNTVYRRQKKYQASALETPWTPRRPCNKGVLQAAYKRATWKVEREGQVRTGWPEKKEKREREREKSES